VRRKQCEDFVEASEIKATREQLILKRSQIINELRTRGDQWREFEQPRALIGARA